MDFFNNILIGFQVAIQPFNFFLAFLGCLVGTLVGVLPGLGPVATISILLPISYQFPAVGAIFLLSGIYYGAMYGGSTTSILVNIPGEASSVMTCVDGYQMAKQGRAGPALAVAAIGSFIAGTLGIAGMALLSPPLAKVAISFGPPEYTSLMVLGFMILTFLARTTMAKALLSAAFGLFLSTIGLDAVSGESRFMFSIRELYDGVGLVPVVMGLFGISEVFLNLEGMRGRQEVNVYEKLNLFPTREDWGKFIPASLRGTIIGFFLGILPGGGATLASFVSYGIEKKLSKYPEKFGTGVVEGVASPEAANNAACQGSFIPLMTLGIPANAVMAVLLGALLIHGITPGPLLLKNHPDLFWGLIVSMYIGNLMLIFLNLPLLGIWVQVLRVPYNILFPLIILLCVIGVYSVNNSVVDIIIMIVFGIVGYIMKKTDYEGAPLVLALVLGGIFENSLRQSLMLSDGSLTIFFSRPISLGFLITAMFILVIPFILIILRKKRLALGVDEGM